MEIYLGAIIYYFEKKILRFYYRCMYENGSEILKEGREILMQFS